MLIPLSAILSWLITYKYFILFPLSVVEGPIVTILAGSFIPVGLMNIFIAFPLIVAGEFLGDAIYYLIGSLGSGKFIERWGRYIGITRERVEIIENHYKKHTGKTLIIAKFSHFVGGAFMIAAGMAKVPYRKYFWFNLIATVPKTVLLILIGYYFGQAYVELNRGIGYVSAGVFLVAILLLVGYIILQRKSRKAVEN